VIGSVENEDDLDKDAADSPVLAAALRRDFHCVGLFWRAG
jgi:hypothetical protein